ERVPGVALQRATEGLAVVQRLIQEPKAPRLWWVTTGAVAATPEETPELATSALWGLGRTVMQEHPELRCKLLDLERSVDATDLLLRELGARDDESQVAWRGERRLVARLVRAPATPIPDTETLPTPLDPRGTVLITGGTGALGALVARHLVAAHD